MTKALMRMLLRLTAAQRRQYNEATVNASSDAERLHVARCVVAGADIIPYTPRVRTDTASLAQCSVLADDTQQARVHAIRAERIARVRAGVAISHAR